MRDAVAAGIPRRAVAELVERGLLERETRGVYELVEEWPDPLACAQLRFAKGVFSHLTALHLLDLTEGVPERWDMTFPRGFNTSNVLKTGIAAHVCPVDLHAEGVIEVETMFGNVVKAYCAERSLCEILRGKGVDVQEEVAAWRAYFRTMQPDFNQLDFWAVKLRVGAKARAYIKALA